MNYKSGHLTHNVHCKLHFSWAAMTALGSANFFSASRLASAKYSILKNVKKLDKIAFQYWNKKEFEMLNIG